jgi:hypothetical protein
MAKAASPVRLEKSLMEAATIAGQTMHRSAAEQIEYWADLGRKVSKVVNPDTLLEINAGLAQINIKKVKPVNVNPDSVFASLDQKRDSGALSEAIASGSVRYQSCQKTPGLLEQVQPDGTIIPGRFVNGKFIPSDS